MSSLFLFAIKFWIFSAFLVVNRISTSSDFAKWKGLCVSGTRQSPIDLNEKSSKKESFKKLYLQGHRKNMRALFVNNGHTLKLYSFSKTVELKGGPLRDIYIVQQIHFHWRSEHTFQNETYPLECHIVHRNVKYDDLTEATKHKDGVAVIGFLYHFGKTQNSGLKNLAHSIDKIKSHKKLNKPIKIKSLIIKKLIPKLSAYFTYDGSLTTPNCEESVTWIVLNETFSVTSDQMKFFSKIECEPNKKLIDNYREIQPLNDRIVVFVAQNTAMSPEVLLLTISISISYWVAY